MKMRSNGSIFALLVAAQAFFVLSNEDQLGALAPEAKHRHGHHHHGHHHHKSHAADAVKNAAVKASNASRATPKSSIGASPTKLMMKMKKLENELSAKERQEMTARRGELEMNGPLPANFAAEFAAEVAKATGCKAEDVKVLNTTQLKEDAEVDEVIFEAPPECVKEIQEQAADPDSKLAKGPLRIFLIEKNGEDDKDEKEEPEGEQKKKTAELKEDDADAPDGLKPEEEAELKGEKEDKEEKEKKEEKEEKESNDGDEETPVQDKGIDIDTSMPYGELEPFGREDTAQELTRGSIKESDEMVDQLERAEVAEEKRAVFRALTRLRGAAITSFDGVARSQTGNIDTYARTNHWRSTHPVRHLADEESDVGKWAFPDNSDF